MKKGKIVGSRKLGKMTTEVKNMKFNELAEMFIKQVTIKGRAEQTIVGYQYHSSYFNLFLGENNFCKDITESTLEEYILHIKNVKAIDNVNTINSYLRNISPILKFGIKKGYILEDFPIPFVKGQQKMKEIYTQEELNTLLEKPKKKDFIEIRTWTIIWTLASTGIRARELRELQVKNVDLLNRTIIVNKTKNKQPRVIPISASLQEVLEEYLKLRGGEIEDYFFPSVYNNRIAMSTLQKAVKDYANSRGIEKTSLHLFRHTFITNAVNSNVSPLILKRITGHSTLQQLNRYYNSKTTDLIEVIDSFTPSKEQKTNKFNRGGRK